MRARDIVGKTVKALHQDIKRNPKTWRVESCIEKIEFTDGTILMFHVSEWETGYGVDGIVIKKKKAEAKP